MIDGTQRILLEKYDPANPKLLELLQASTGINECDALPVHKDASSASQSAAESDIEMRLLQERARKLIEAAKKAQEERKKNA